MFKLFRMVFILACLVCSLGFSQDYGWAIDKEEGSQFFPIGWSKNGSRFAYGIFDLSYSIAVSSALSVTVQDIVEDEPVWNMSESWQESLQGEGSTQPDPPRSARGAWKQLADRAAQPLHEHGITPGGNRSAEQFPMLGDRLYVTLDQRGETEYSVTAFSRELGSKEISNIKIDSPANKLSILGYFPNPDGSRIAVIIQEKLDARWGYSNYYVIGCHRRIGFKQGK